VLLRNDYPVDFRTEESIKAIADRARNLLDPSCCSDFQVVDGIRRLTTEPLLKRGFLELKLFRASQNGHLAFVVFKPTITLNVDEEVWQEASDNFPWARRVIAHELGHILLHERYTPTFSGQKDKWIPVSERSGEWQAMAGRSIL
jgi:Zn-dependent peptidase ImmA (M78 family)